MNVRYEYVCILRTHPAQAMRVMHAQGAQDKTNTTMTTAAILASFHSLLRECCFTKVDFLELSLFRSLNTHIIQ